MVDALSAKLDYTTLAILQQEDDELKTFLQCNTGLQFKQVQLPGTYASVLCDIMTSAIRPLIRSIGFRI